MSSSAGAADYFASAPLTDPLSYPGAIPPYSYLLLGRRKLIRLDAAAGITLDAQLSSVGGALLAERAPILAIGSNAAPAQLARKFAELVSGVVPVLQASVRGLRVLPSAHLNPAGYIPWAPADADPRSELAAFVTFVDQAQLARLDETEPNYVRVPLDPDRHPVRLSGAAEPLECCEVYASRHGVIVDGRVVRVGEVPDQRELRRRLLTTVDDGDLAAAIAAVKRLRYPLRSPVNTDRPRGR